MDFGVWFFVGSRSFLASFLVLLVPFSEDSDAAWLWFGFSGFGFRRFFLVLQLVFG
jgi:hypothetical protein